MINYTIGAVKKKKSTAKKKTTAKKVVAKKSVAKKRSYAPSTKPKDKGWKVTSTCSTAGADLKTKRSSSAAGVLALCKASVNKLNMTASALKKYAVTKGRLSRYK
jgi:hypothetical protein